MSDKQTPEPARLRRRDILRAAGAAATLASLPRAEPLPAAQPPAGPARRNIVFVLSDDHRYDFMGCVPGCPKFLETPHMDRMARQGALLANAFVSTSLCSPSRASILTGQYMHHHHVVDNQRPEPAGIAFFPQYLQRAGYQTAFLGKWHMGHEDDKPRPGFDYWAGLKGQGEYDDPVLNINGQRKPMKGSTTDILTDLALEWLSKGRDASKPFCLYLSHKAVHFPFEPLPRHRGLYKDAPVHRPETMANTEQNYRSQPRWVRQRRFGIHGVDHMETGQLDNDPVPNFDDLYRRYAETVHGLDENLGRVLKHLDETGLAKNTLVLYMGDNGFELGEHGFYDKRDAYEQSIRVPMLAYAPGLIQPGTKVTQMVQNIDVAATLLEAAGVSVPAGAKMDGRSFLPLLGGQSPPWRDHILYEYHWEWNFPATPTLFALRTDRYKYVYHYGIWDLDCLYDLQSDPEERYNLIEVPACRELAQKMREQLFTELAASGALEIPVRPPAGERLGQRKIDH